MWEKIKQFFGIETEKDKEENAEKEGEKKKLSETQYMLYDKLKDMDEAWKEKQSNRWTMYEDIMPEEYEWTPMQYDGESEDEIRTRIYDYYTPIKDEKSKALDDEYTAKIEAQNAKRKTTLEEAEKAHAANRQTSQDNLDKIKATQAGKGLARSSIKSNLDEEAQKNFEQMRDQIFEKYASNIGEIDYKIQQLDAQRKEALGDLDISFAKSITSDIDKLIKERNAELDKIQKYNNEQTLKAAEYKENRAKLIQKQKEDIANIQAKEAESEAKNGYSGEKLDEYQKRLNLALEFYQALPKDIAYELVQNNQKLKNYLGLMYGNLVSALNG
ncbi:MAG: hypothetical protein ACI4MY_04615 [Christensenellales bacterium]